MVSLGRNVKIWIFITLCSLLAWILYWIPSSIDRFFTMDGTPWNFILQNFGEMFIIMEMSGAIGMLIRFAGVILAIFSLLLIMRNTKKFWEIKNWAVSALILESVYFILLLPSSLFLFGFGRKFGEDTFIPGLTSLVLGGNFLLIVLLTAPFLLILAMKLHKYDGGGTGFKSWKWISITFVSYIASLWVNSVVKWFEMVNAERLSFFAIGVRSLGAINSFLLMSMALVLSIGGALSLFKKDFNSASKWLGLSLAFVGLHYLIFVIYSYLVGIEGFLMLAEIWAIPLLGLGLTLLVTKFDNN